MQVTVAPLKYDHPFDGQVIERVLPLEESRKLCADIGINADACSGYVTGSDGGRSCFIVLPSDGFDTVDAYRRHEVAHCNGWPANHMD